MPHKGTPFFPAAALIRYSFSACRLIHSFCAVTITPAPPLQYHTAGQRDPAILLFISFLPVNRNCSCCINTSYHISFPICIVPLRYYPLPRSSRHSPRCFPICLPEISILRDPRNAPGNHKQQVERQQGLKIREYRKNPKNAEQTDPQQKDGGGNCSLSQRPGRCKVSIHNG